MSLETFIADVTNRYPVAEIVVFGSRARGGSARPDSDWDVLVLPSDGAPADVYTRLVEDETLQRHFDTFLDVFALDERGRWHWPSWTNDEMGGRGFFVRHETLAGARVVWGGEPSD